MTDQPARVTPGEISALLDHARQMISGGASLDEQIAYHEHKASLLSPVRRRPGHRRGAPGGGRRLALRADPGRPPRRRCPGGGGAVKMSAFSGDQIAQVNNPDPFAVPVWRSPVYHTPGWVITIVQLARAVKALIAFLARHPLATLTAAVLALAWYRFGWPGPVILTASDRRGAGGVVVAVAGLVPPPRARPGAGEVAALALPAALGRGHDHRPPGPGLPGAAAAAGHGQGHLHAVHRPGADRDRVRPVRRGLRPPRRGPGPRVRRAAVPGPVGPAGVAGAGVRPPRRPGRHHPRPAHPRPVNLKALAIGRREDGSLWLVRLHGTHLLVAGATGAGKASIIWGLIRAIFPALRAGLVRLLGADPKRMELSYGREIFDTYGPTPPTPPTSPPCSPRPSPTCKTAPSCWAVSSVTTRPRPSSRSW